MYQKFFLSSLSLSLAMAVSSVRAAEPVLLQKAKLNDVQQTFQLVLPNAKKKASISAEDTLQFIKQHTDERKITHVRMQQQYAGFPVLGGYAIMHSSQQANMLLTATNHVNMNGILYRGLKEELGEPHSSFVANANHALQQFTAQFQKDVTSDATVTPMVYINAKHQAFWAYKMSILVSRNDQIPERPTAIVDAQTLKPFVQWNDLKTARSLVNGIGFGGNQRTGQYQFGKDFPLLPITRDDDTATCYMEYSDVKVVDMAHHYIQLSNPMEFKCKKNTQILPDTYWTGYKSDGYDKENGAFSPTNDALYVGYVIHNLYKEWYGLDVLTEQGEKPMQLVMRVHFGNNYENAFWDSKEMTFGDGDTMLYPLVSLGVGAHEISHGFTEQHSNLDYYSQSGGMNESFSDMAAQAAEYYSVGKSSWAIGAEIMKKGSPIEAIRFMDKPSRDGASIDTANAYFEGLDVHYSSGVYNRLFYLLATTPQWDPRKAFQVMIKANMDYWTPQSTFSDGACGVISAANDFGYSIADVKQALDQVAINYKNCL